VFGANLTRADLTALLGRILLVALFLIEASAKITGYAGAVTYMEKFGVPGLLLPLTIAFELGAALLILVGWHTRLVAYALGGFCVMTALIFHANLADMGQSLHFWKDFAIAGGLLQLAANGPGKLSIVS
jgi:putative oxidoreductase